MYSISKRHSRFNLKPLYVILQYKENRWISIQKSSGSLNFKTLPNYFNKTIRFTVLNSPALKRQKYTPLANAEASQVNVYWPGP